MRDYEEKSYYEIQLDNKQLILVFLAGVTVCVLVFVLGVMVGQGKKEAEMAAIKNEVAPVKTLEDRAQPQEIQTTDERPKKDKGNRKANKEKQFVQSEPAKEKQKIATPVQPVKEKYSYYDLDKSDSEKPLTKEPEKTKPEKDTAPAIVKTQEPEPLPAAATGGGNYTVQVMATGSKDKATQQLEFLKSKGYTAFLSEDKLGSGSSVFKVRVGRFGDSDSAKKIASRLKEDLQLDTWVSRLD